MADVKWIKICTDIFADEKILLIESMPEADGIIVCWFKLLCLAGKQNNSGVFMLNDKLAYTDEMLATIFRRPLNTVRLALKTFHDLGMIEIIEGTITIPNWEKHQSLDKLEKEIATKTDTITELLKKQEFYEKEKLTKFAERLKDRLRYTSLTSDVLELSGLEFDGIEVEQCIDETLKEFEI